MNRKIVPWHPIAIQLREQGATVKQVWTALQSEPNPPTFDTVKKMLAEARKDPATAVAKVSRATDHRLKASVLLDEIQNAEMAELLIRVEKGREQTLHAINSAVHRYLSLAPNHGLTPEQVRLIERQAAFALLAKGPILAKTVGEVSAAQDFMGEVKDQLDGMAAMLLEEVKAEGK